MTAAGIVTFNPEIDLLEENLAALVQQCDQVIIVDNNSGNIDQVEGLIAGNPQISLIKNDRNLGIACALNQIVKHFAAAGCRWVLLMDQDSVIADNLLAVYSRFIDFEQAAILTPRVVDRSDELPGQPVTAEPYKIVRRAITSGSYLNIPICEQLGYFDEAMFIDYVDFEYCIRVRKAGFNIMLCRETQILHRLGDIKWVRFFGRKFMMTNHSAKRSYYFARNIIYCLNKHRDYIKARDEYEILFDRVWKIVAFEQQKISKLSAIIKGVCDGRKLFRQQKLNGFGSKS
jgi:rhamnosyltransferase